MRDYNFYLVLEEVCSICSIYDGTDNWCRRPDYSRSSKCEFTLRARFIWEGAFVVVRVTTGEVKVLL